MKLTFKLSKEAIAKYLLQGKEMKEFQVIEVDFSTLTDHQRQAVLRNGKLQSENEIKLGIAGFEYVTLIGDYVKTGNFYSSNYCEFNSIDLDEIIAEMEKRETEYLAAKKKEDAQVEAKKVKEEAAKEATMKSNLNALKLFSEGGNAKFEIDYLNETINSSDVASKKHAGESIIQYINQVIEKIKPDESLASAAREKAEWYVNQYEIEKSEKKAKEDARKEELRAWSIQNGSELLKARIEENFNWHELALDEFYASIMPAGFEEHDDDDYDSCWDYNNPSLDHINELREARKNSVFESVELRKCRKEEDGTKTFYYFVVGNMRNFYGNSTFEVSKLIDTEEISEDED